ncbi:hypothetical protein TIFTF001_020999 [Ficus carica]|uniref:Uncharacterized protein n=1 Tax=Ficus carica TaxID=3494 RepID=A0AA88AJM0_FICCA|nr:hypothetical protein TIFTF001_020999 [Ficus carica]
MEVMISSEWLRHLPANKEIFVWPLPSLQQLASSPLLSGRSAIVNSRHVAEILHRHREIHQRSNNCCRVDEILRCRQSMATATVLGSEQRHELGSHRRRDLRYRPAIVTQEERHHDSMIAKIALASCCRDHKVFGSRCPSPVHRPCRNGPLLLNRDRTDGCNLFGRWRRTRSTTSSPETLTELREKGCVLSETPPDLAEGGDRNEHRNRMSLESLPNLAPGWRSRSPKLCNWHLPNLLTELPPQAQRRCHPLSKIRGLRRPIIAEAQQSPSLTRLASLPDLRSP